MSENENLKAAIEPSKEGRNKDGTFAKGFVSNPAGKPKGTRHRSTLAVEALLGGEAEGLTRKAIATVSFQLPRMETAADAIKALSAVAEAVAAGEISPGEGAEFGKLIDSYTRNRGI